MYSRFPVIRLGTDFVQDASIKEQDERSDKGGYLANSVEQSQEEEDLWGGSNLN